jgi:hypothetical protein
MWAELLGFGDFYYELGVQIVEACMATRNLNGGLMDLQTLQQAVVRRRGSLADPISNDDIVRAIKKLKVPLEAPQHACLCTWPPRRDGSACPQRLVLVWIC